MRKKKECTKVSAAKFCDYELIVERTACVNYASSRAPKDRVVYFETFGRWVLLDIHVTDLSVSGTAGQTNITKTPRSVPSSVTIDWTKTSTTEIPEPQERPSVSQKLVWGLLSGVLAVLVIALAVAVLLCWNRSRSRRTRKKDKESNGYAHQSTPLMQQRK